MAYLGENIWKCNNPDCSFDDPAHYRCRECKYREVVE